MKMPRSQCETGNIQFVQELAEVDGPFEAPININFRDLTKLELPSLVWNRSDACPRKMKITNTGHTVIVSGKWKCERPYLTGGPLLGKYVFSQIHFHWGHSDCKGSEHQICGEEFPLEMHVAHFKTEYLTQESALREKDGMVVVVYLFKLQDEPNHSLKKIISSLPRVKQPSTSHPIDPRPILSLCNPFTDDYFMYWGSVVTSTCAHILLWIICREPFGISREQVNEFRKIMDTSQQPICKNSRDVQPLHKRNVFHVNASKHLDEPLLPVKKLLGCYCKESKDAFSAENSDNCHCKGAFQNQEDVEGINVDSGVDKLSSDIEGLQAMHGCFGNRNFFVQTATVESLSIAFKRPRSDPVRNQCPRNKLKKVKSEAYCHKTKVRIVSKSCCFFSKLDAKKNGRPLTEKRKNREKNKLFDSSKAFTQLMHSLEALKNQTFKKLKKIDSINQEIKQMKPFCQDNEDKRWVRRIEKMLTRQRRITLKSSHGCFSELKKLAKDCNFDKYVDAKALPSGDNDQKMVWISNTVMATEQMPCYDAIIENDEIAEIENKTSKILDAGKAMKFSEAQNLIGSFFEDIKDTEDLDEVKNDPNFQKFKSICSLKEDPKSVMAKNKGYITQKMFNLGNLGDRFFTEVTTEDMDFDEKWDEAQSEEFMTPKDASISKNEIEGNENEKPAEVKTNEVNVGNSGIIPLRRTNITVLLPKSEEEAQKETLETSARQDASFGNEKNKKLSSKKTTYIKKPVNDREEELTDEKFLRTNEIKIISLGSKSSSSNLSTESTGNQREKSKNKKSLYGQKKQKSSVEFKTSSKKLHNKISCKMLESSNKHKKSLKNKKRKKHKGERYKNLSSTSKEEENVLKKPKRKKTTKVQTKPQTEKNKPKIEDVPIENALISPERKKLKLERNKLTIKPLKEDVAIITNNNVFLAATETRTLLTSSSPRQQVTESIKKKQESFKGEETKQKYLKEYSSGELQTFDIVKHDSKTKSKTHRNKTYRASSVDSKTSHPKINEPKELEENQFDSRVKTVEREVPKMLEGKPLSKSSCRSLTDVSATPKADFPQRLYIESLDNRKKIDKSAFILRVNIDNARKSKDGHVVVKKPSQEVPKETTNKNEEQERKEPNDSEIHEKLETKTQRKTEVKTELPAEKSYRNNDDFLPTFQILEEKKKETPLKRCSPDKYQFLEKEPQKASEEHVDILRLTDSEKSFVRNTSKPEENFLVADNKNLQTSISCSTLKLNSTSRPHSAETLHSLKKTLKRKSKKRPHCSKKNSRHYIKKNYNMHRKPSKPFNFMSLTDEEQLKIISLNVANYLKQKLMDEKILPETEKNTPSNAEKEMNNPNVTEEKPKETPVKRPSTDCINRFKTKKFKIPVLKSALRSREKEKLTDKDVNKEKEKDQSKDKEKEKTQTNIKKPHTADSLIEATKPKPVPPSSPKPVNNFIKINKQKAGMYKRSTTSANLPKLESKEKAKSNPEAKPASEIPRIKRKVLKTPKEKLPAQKPKEEFLSRPPTPLSPVSQIPSPKGVFRKERQMRSSMIKKPQISDAKSVKESSNIEKPKGDIDAKSKTETEKLPSSSPEPKEVSQTKKSLIPTCSLKINLGGPQKTENKPTLQEVIKENIKDNVEEENRNEILFKKELEYFITMQMYLNKEITKDIGNPLNYFNSKLLSSELNAKENATVSDSIQNFDFSNNDLVVVQKKNLEDCPSSCSELAEYQITNEKEPAIEEIPKNTLSEKAPTDFNDSIPIKAIPVREGSEDSPSDSSYDCKISITLNTNQKEVETEKQVFDTYCLEDNFNSQITTSVEGSTSQITEAKLENDKSKESDISTEVKKKLLEILEGEIKRKIEMSCGVSSGNSSDGIPSKMEDSEGNLRSQSMESSSSDNISLAQVSSSIRQYLTYLREIKRLPDESKDYEEF